MSFFEDIGNFFNRQQLLLKAKQPSDFWLWLDNSNLSLRRGRIFRWRLKQLLTDIQNEIAQSPFTAQLNTALNSGSDIDAAFDNYYSHYNQQLIKIHKLRSEYSFTGLFASLWFRTTNKIANYFTKSFITSLHFNTFDKLIAEIDAKLKAENISSPQLEGYQKGLASIKSKLAMLKLGNKYTKKEQQRFDVFLDKINTINNEIIGKLSYARGLSTGLSEGLKQGLAVAAEMTAGIGEIQAEIKQQFNLDSENTPAIAVPEAASPNSTDPIAKVKNDGLKQLRKLQETHKKILVRFQKAGKQAHEDALINAANPSLTIEDTIQKAFLAVEKIVKKDILASDSEYAKSSAEFKSFIDAMDVLFIARLEAKISKLTHKSNRSNIAEGENEQLRKELERLSDMLSTAKASLSPSANALYTLMTKHSYNMNDGIKTAKLKLKEYLSIVEARISEINKSPSSGAKTQALKQEWLKLIELTNGVTRLYGLSDYSDLFSKVVEADNADARGKQSIYLFQKQLQAYDSQSINKRTLLATASMLFYKFFNKFSHAQMAKTEKGVEFFTYKPKTEIKSIKPSKVQQTTFNQPSKIEAKETSHAIAAELQQRRAVTAK